MKKSIVYYAALTVVALAALNQAQAAPQQVAGAKCNTVQLDDYGSLTVQAGGKTVNVEAPINFKCGTLSVQDDGKTLKVTGKNLAETLSIFPKDSTFAQVWGLYVVNFKKAGVLSIVDSSDGTVPSKATLAGMKDSIGSASATFSQTGGKSGWIFQKAQMQTVKYDPSKPVTVTFKDSGATQPFSQIVLDAKKGTLQAKRNSIN